MSVHVSMLLRSLLSSRLCQSHIYCSLLIFSFLTRRGTSSKTCQHHTGKTTAKTEQKMKLKIPSTLGDESEQCNHMCLGSEGADDLCLGGCVLALIRVVKQCVDAPSAGCETTGRRCLQWVGLLPGRQQGL